MGGKAKDEPDAISYEGGSKTDEPDAASYEAGDKATYEPDAISYKGGPQTEDEPDATIWESCQIPSSIRKPWDIFEEDLEDTLNDLSDATEEAVLRARLDTVQAAGALVAFAQLPKEDQHAFEEVSIVELAAYAHYGRYYSRGRGADGEEQAAQAWSSLGSEEMAEWVIERPWHELAADPRLAPYLRRGRARRRKPRRRVSFANDVGKQ